MKTIKFSEVVKICGEPSVHLAWVDPARDQTLKRALTENRIMTLHQELHGGKKDFGSIGFLKDRHAQLLIFSKSLRKFCDRKVIAIDYSLIADGQLNANEGSREKPRQKGGNTTPVSKPSVTHPAKAKMAALKNNTKLPEKPEIQEKGARQKVVGIEEVLREVKRAVAELSAGKSVPAYDRLKRLLVTAKV